MSDVKKPHRFRSGTRARMEMGKLRGVGKVHWDRKGIANVAMKRAILDTINAIRETDREYADFGALADGVVERMSGVCTCHAVRNGEAARLVLYASKPTRGQAKILQARHLWAVCEFPDILTGRRYVPVVELAGKSKGKKHATTEEPSGAVDDA